MIRVGVTFNRTFYFVDKGVQRGAAYEYGKLFEDELNKKLKTGNTKVNVVFVPLPRDLLASALHGRQGRSRRGAGHRHGRNCRRSWTSPTPPARTSARSS